MLTQPLERLIEELKTAVQQQTLDASILEVLSGGRSVTVGGDVHGATIVTGDHNVVVSHHLGGTNIDEGKLLQTSIDALENGLKSQLNSNQTVPYRGLAPFRLQDAAFYFGRDEEQALILSLMRSKPVLWLHGQSGTGKTSLIQAGLLPQLLEEDTLPIYIRAFDESPTIALKKVILKARWSPELDLAKQSLLTYLARLAAVTHQKRLVLLFDQFEEFFTKVQDETRKQFIVEVADSLNSTELNLCVVFSIRSDYFGETLQIRERISQVESAEYRLAAIGHLAARQAIIRPLEQLHVEYEAKVIASILTELGDTEVSSSQLQLVCDTLFNSVDSAKNLITYEDYQSQGGAEGILRNHLREVIHNSTKIPVEQQKSARYLLATLMTVDGERDRKTLAEWYADSTFQPAAIAWHFKEIGQSNSEGVYAAKTLERLALEHHLAQIQSVSSFSAAELKAILWEFRDSITSQFTQHIIINYVNELVERLKGIRLIQEVQTEMGEVTHELVHDCLIKEVQTWLSEDELEAKRIEGMLRQRRIDYEAHGLLLSTAELNVILAQMDNPIINLSESQKRLLLYSAVAAGYKPRFLKFVDAVGITWLREAYQDSTLPYSVRKGAVMNLSILEDLEIFNELCKSATEATVNLWRSEPIELLAQYIHYSNRTFSLSFGLQKVVAPKVALLRIQDGSSQRAQMRRVSVTAAITCVIIMFIFTSANNNIFTNLFLTVLLGVLSTVTAFIFAEGLLSVTLILSRSLLIVRLLGLTVTGSILGYLLYLFLVDGQIGWMAGGVTGATLSVRHWLDSQKPNIKQVSVGFIAIFVALISVLQLYYFGDSQTATTLIAAAIISFLFTLVFLRYAFLSQS